MPQPGGFAALDDQARSRHVGYTLVHCSAVVSGAVARHLRRQTEATGRKVLCVDGASLAEPWRELGQLLRIEAQDDPVAFAASLFRRIGRCAVLVCAHDATHWGAMVGDELAALASRRRFEGWVVELGPGRHCPHARPVKVAETAEPSDLERWWQALWQAERREGDLAHVERLDEGEQWWWAVRAAVRAPGSPLGPDARALLARLGACRRLVPERLQAELGTRNALSELVERDLLVISEDGSACPRHAALVLARDDALAASAALSRSGDPWDGIRAAELLLGVGDLDRAAELAQAVLGTLLDPCARTDLWSRWQRALASSEAPRGAELFRSFSELALRLGDAEQALALARQAAAHAGERQSHELLLCVGRAAMANGEYATARVALERAQAAATSDAARARALVELAACWRATGDASRASELAKRAMALAADAPTGFAARSILGKLLLAREAWREAEQHFAEVAHDASCLGELEAQLHAELEQAAALVVGGGLDAAQAKLQQVLDTASRRGQQSVSAMALSELAALAARRHDFAETLRLRERAARLFGRIGHRRWLARSIIRLAQTRVELGLVDEAEQGLAYARRVLGSGLPGAEATLIGLVSCRVRLARHDTVRAASAIQDALRSARDSSDGSMLAECHCQAAQVALAEGHAAGAAHHIAMARRSTGAATLQAEIALLDAMLARLEERPFGPLAQLALDAAHRVGDGRRSAEALRLMSLACSSTGDLAQARAQRERAAALDESLVAGLPKEVGARCRALLASRAPECVDGAPPPSGTAPSRNGRRELVGSHPAMQRLLRAIEKVAPTDATVLVTGESGTGKELVADALHRYGRRRSGPLIKINCAALAESLLLSELFGHEKGAFTGATNLHRGCFEAAAGGTLFLDEIGDISPGTQAALLRVLQDRTFLRVGGTELVHADVRVVCATHRDLHAMTRVGCFREDLYYRLSALVLAVPPLRERVDDLPLLCTELLSRIAREHSTAPKRLSSDALALLSRQPWPGNVRELENALRVASLFVDGDVLTAAELRRYANGARERRTSGSAAASALSHDRGASDGESAPLSARARSGQPTGLALPELGSCGDAAAMPTDACDIEELAYGSVRSGAGLRDFQKRLELHCIVRALSETQGHVGRAAALLGIKRPRLSQLIKEYALNCSSEER